VDDLTQRELDILSLFGRGHTAEEIGSILGIAPRTAAIRAGWQNEPSGNAPTARIDISLGVGETVSAKLTLELYDLRNPASAADRLAVRPRRRR
jgi:hypothetical protein